MRVLIIEDEIIIARFIEQQVKANFNCTTAIALNFEEVRMLVPKLLPHLILCDINLNEEHDGIHLIEQLQSQYAFGIIYITSYQSKAIIERALNTKPLNYIIKPVDETKVYTAIKLVENAVISHLKFGQELSNTLPINAIELQIVRLILKQQTTKQIAETLFLSPYTIKNYRHRICTKLNLKDENNALLKWAMQNEDLIS
ncbi:response regulator transcription factor [Pedobacter nanyangensis]|uniref:response regulator transcription factor n=1 Tax=Pedobacter nanyangensis TaxID=1562389 RepID=UPI000DE3CBF4|nr:DNA-binding response regulator [Pedobacter nanyangensis]